MELHGNIHDSSGGYEWHTTVVERHVKIIALNSGAYIQERVIPYV